MRFRLHLTLSDDNKRKWLPIDYQYMQSAVIYRILGTSDEAYASWLHDNGYQLANGKRFKLFCYSRFHLNSFHVDTHVHTISINDRQMEWIISFLPERSTQEFVQGLFNGTQFTIGDGFNHLRLQVTGLEMLRPLSFDTKDADAFCTIDYVATSPVCVKQHLNSHTQYLSPTDAHYADGIRKGLLSRYEGLYGKPFGGDTSKFSFELLPARVKSSLVDIKGIKVRGYRYDFRLTAPPELHHIAYDGGIGEECSQGFGFIERRGK